jgi:CRP-like cAMP-binding protein
MNCITPLSSSNELLSMLPPAELTLLRPLLTSVRLVNGQTLYEAGECIEQVFFVQQGFVSMVAEADGDNPGTEVGLVGREGVVGLPVLLSPQAVSFNRAMVQMPGTAHRLAAQVLHDHASNSKWPWASGVVHDAEA